MKKIAILIINLLLSTLVQAQLIENRLNICFSYSTGNFSGSETINENNYISPSLFSNYNKFSGFSVKGIINSKDYLSYGINYELQSASEWESPNYSDFENSVIKINSISPIIRIHNRFKEKGLSNKLFYYIECGPTIGLSNLALSKPLFEIQPHSNNLSLTISDNNLFAGIEGTLGIEYSYAQNWAFMLSYSYGMNWISSRLYNDSSMKTSIVNIGLVLKLKKNKYFYY